MVQTDAVVRSAAVRRIPLIPLVAVLVAMLYAYRDVGAALVAQWAADENYSHGFLVLPLAMYFAWKRRQSFAQLSLQPSLWGAVLIVGGLFLLVAGVAAAELFVARASFVCVIAGSVLFLFGHQHLRVLVFPIGFLFLMIPPPEVLFNEVALPLQLFASRAGEIALRGFGVAVLRDGNVLELVGMRLEVAEACSGIRSLVALLAFALMIGECSGSSTPRLWLLAASTLPIAILANAARIAATGLAAHTFGRAAADGLLHTTSGLLVFAVAVCLLLLFERALERTAPRLAQEAAR